MTTPLAPSGQRFTLERPQLHAAILEVRHLFDTPPQINLNAGFQLLEHMCAAPERSTWTVVTAEEQEFHLELNEHGPKARHAKTSGVRLSQVTTGLEVTVLPSATVVQASRYERWSESFKPIALAALSSVETVLSPVACSRVGLRYVNVFKDAEAHHPSAWSERFQGSLVASATHGPFGDQLEGAQSQLALSLSATRKATIRHGFLPDVPSLGNIAFMLDIDVAETASQRFFAQDAIKVAEQLNRGAAELFRRSLSGDYAAHLGYTPVEAPEGSENA